MFTAWVTSERCPLLSLLKLCQLPQEDVSIQTKQIQERPPLQVLHVHASSSITLLSLGAGDMYIYFLSFTTQYQDISKDQSLILSNWTSSESPG